MTSIIDLQLALIRTLRLYHSDKGKELQHEHLITMLKDQGTTIKSMAPPHVPLEWPSRALILGDI